VVAFGQHAEAEARLLHVSLQPDCSAVRASILGQEVTYKIGAPGRHLVVNSLAVMAAVSLVGADLALAALSLARVQPPSGRGARTTIWLPLGGSAVVIDESYNANPASMRAAIALLGQAAVGPKGRRIAVLGDMLELGPTGAALHRELAEPLEDAEVDLVFCAGPLMRSLWEALPPHRRGSYAQDSATLEPTVLAAIEEGDVIMIKGSLGSRMGPIAKALVSRYTRESAREPASAGI
jgi:UDP-N-acetylmuramoyl-tripeptide--D-alanyl-D-alanine ligase